MPTYLPSILNDVIGPVMRGPSSSHCAAALRIGRIARDLMGGSPTKVLVEFDPNGSLATTHESQGSDMGLCAGLLGMEATDERLVESVAAARLAGIQVEYAIVDYGATHPNTYRMRLENEWTEHTITALSTGGGMIEVIEIDGASLSMGGDFYETLVFLDDDGGPIIDELVASHNEDYVITLTAPLRRIFEIKRQAPLNEATVAAIMALPGVREVAHVSPVLPILSRRGMSVPFSTPAEMMSYNRERGVDLAELAIRYESERGEIAPQAVLDRMIVIVGILTRSIERGIQGTEYEDRILGQQSDGFQDALSQGRLLDGGVLNRMILYITALMEVKSSMGVIVAAPTAGSCGGLPGAVLGAGRALEADDERIARAMLAAGLIGVFVASGATFAAEVGGCQAECGAGSGMAAAGLVTLVGGTTAQAVAAASIALQNILGMICDPVANRVEVPCLGKNVMGASNALACANMALAGYDQVIPLDQVIETMDRVGKSLPSELRCTALGGLSITPASKEIEARLKSTHDM
jgi:L-serine dehydratase